MIRSLLLAATAIIVSAASATAQLPERAHAAPVPPGLGPAMPPFEPAMPAPASHVPALPHEASAPDFGRTALLSSVGSFAGLFGGALAGAGLSGGTPNNGVVALMFTGSVVGASWVGGSTSGRGGQALLGSLLGSAVGIAFLTSAQPEFLGGVISYSVIQGITTAIATSF